MSRLVQQALRDIITSERPLSEGQCWIDLGSL